VTNVNLLHVPEPGCQPQGVFQIKGIQSQHANLSTCHPHWNDKNINPLNTELNPICRLLALLGAHHTLHISRISVKILQDIKRISINLQYSDIRTRRRDADPSPPSSAVVKKE